MASSSRRNLMRFTVRQPMLTILPSSVRNRVDQAASPNPVTKDLHYVRDGSVGPDACFFPVRRIYCVGRNYRDHAIEMGGNPDREPPFFFQKPSDACVDCTTTLTTTITSAVHDEDDGQKIDSAGVGNNNIIEIPYPPKTSNLHHEVELVVAIDKGGSDIKIQDAEEHIFGYAVGLDLTRRDLQSEAKKKGRPWEYAKAFDYSAPCAAIVPKGEAADILSNPSLVSITLDVNGERKQESTLNHMTWSIPETISILSQYYQLLPGDIILTGTPAGVGPLRVGDIVRGECGNLHPCVIRVGPLLDK